MIPDGFFIRAVWQFEGGSEEILFFSLLPTAALNMAHHDWKEMNKDELSELKISHRAEAIHTRQPIHEFSREKEVIAIVYLFIYF